MEIVKYHNDLNKIVLKDFNSKEIDIFYAIIFKMKNKSEAIFKIEEIKTLATTEYGNRSLERFFKHLDVVFKTQIQIKTATKITDYHLFITKELDKDKNQILIKLHPDCIYILNNFIGNYTQFELQKFLQLQSGYSKILFRLLKQFNDTKKLFITMEEFRVLFEVPVNYEQDNINQKILKPAIKELSSIFKGLKYIKEKNGKKISRIVFTWEDENENNHQLTIQEINVSTLKKEKKLEYSEEVLNLFDLLPDYERVESRKREIAELLKEHSFEYLKTDIEYCNGQRPEKYWSYFIKSINSGHFSAVEIEKAEKEKEQKKEKEQIATKEIERQEKEEEQINELAEQIYNSLTEEMLEEYTEKSGYRKIPEKFRKNFNLKNMILVLIKREIEEEMKEATA